MTIEERVELHEQWLRSMESNQQQISSDLTRVSANLERVSARLDQVTVGLTARLDQLAGIVNQLAVTLLELRAEVGDMGQHVATLIQSQLVQQQAISLITESLRLAAQNQGRKPQMNAELVPAPAGRP